MADRVLVLRGGFVVISQNTARTSLSYPQSYMRNEVKALLLEGVFPSEDNASTEVVKRHEQAYRAIVGPVSDDEASELCKLFGPDDCFGLAWSLLHLLETAPSWPLRDAIARAHPIWADELRERCVRAGIW